MPDPAYRSLLYLMLATVAADIILTSGFMLLRVPPIGSGVPVNQIVLLIGVAVLTLSGRDVHGITTTAPFFCLLGLWTLAFAHLLFGVRSYGAWAIRDSANVMESGFFFIGYCLAGDLRFRLPMIRWTTAVFTFAAFYVLLYPAQGVLAPFSPSISSMSGYKLPLLFSFGNTASIGVVSVCFLLLTSAGPAVARMVLAGAVVMWLIVFVQARITYLQLAFMILLFAMFARRELRNLMMMGLLAATFMILFLLSGIQLPGRLGQTFSLDFLVSHVQAIWGGGGASTRDAAQGVDLRLEWWLEIHRSLSHSMREWLFGLGYGMPLTSFRGLSDDVVREPHNSYVSIYGRLGFMGLLLFLSFIATTLHATTQLVRACVARSDRELFVMATTMLCFFGVHLIYAVAEGGFEVSFIAVPFYFLSGAVVATWRVVKRQSESERPAQWISERSLPR